MAWAQFYFYEHGKSLAWPAGIAGVLMVVFMVTAIIALFGLFSPRSFLESIGIQNTFVARSISSVLLVVSVCVVSITVLNQFGWSMAW